MNVVDGEEGRNVLWRVLSGWSAEQHQREEMEEEKCGEDRKVWWWWGGGKKLSKIASPCKDVYFTVLLLVLCFLTCSWFCVGVTFRFTFLVFLSCLPHCSLPLFFLVVSVCTTPGSNLPLTNPHSLFYPTQVQKNCIACHCSQGKLYTQWNQLEMNKQCLFDGSGIKLKAKNPSDLAKVWSVYVQDTTRDVPFSAFGLDLGSVLAGCCPLFWTLTYDIFWYHKDWDLDVFCSFELISTQ